MALPPLEAKVKLNTKEFDSGIKKMQQSWNSLMNNMAKLGAAGGAAFAGMTYGLKKATEAWAVQESAVLKLSAALKAQNAYTDQTVKHLQKYASTLQQTTKFGDEEILNAMSLMTTFGLTGEKLEQATQATLDLASAYDMDLRTAAMLLGKANEGVTDTLTRYGIIIDQNVPKGEKFAAVIDKISEKVGGQAQVIGASTSGALARFQNAMGDIAETIGKLFSPEVQSITNFVSKFSNALANLSPESQNAINIKMGMSFAGLLAIFGSLALTWKAVSFVVTTGISIITNPWMLLIGAIAAGAVLIISNWDKISEAWAALVEAWNKSSPESLATDWDNFVKAIQEGDIKGIVINAMKITFDTVKWLIGEAEITKDNIVSILNADDSWEAMKTTVAQTWKDGHYLAAGITAIVGFAIAAVKWVWEQTKKAFTATVAVAQAKDSWSETKKQVARQWKSGDYLAAGITATAGFIISAAKWLWGNIKGGVVTAAKLIADANTTWDDVVEAAKKEWKAGNYLAAGIIVTAAGIVKTFQWFWGELKSAVSATKVIANAKHSWAATKKEVSRLWGEEHYLAAGITAIAGAVISGIKWIVDTTLDIAASLKEWYATSDLKKKVDEFKESFAKKPFSLDTIEAGLSLGLQFAVDVTGALADSLKKANDAISDVRKRLSEKIFEAQKKGEKVDFFTVFEQSFEQENEAYSQLMQLGKNMATILSESFKMSFNLLGLIREAIKYAIVSLTGSEQAGEAASRIPIYFAATWAAGTLTNLFNKIKTAGGLRAAAGAVAKQVSFILAIGAVIEKLTSDEDIKKMGADMIGALAAGIGVTAFTKSSTAGLLTFTIALEFDIGSKAFEGLQDIGKEFGLAKDIVDALYNEGDVKALAVKYGKSISMPANVVLEELLKEVEDNWMARWFFVGYSTVVMLVKGFKTAVKDYGSAFKEFINMFNLPVNPEILPPGTIPGQKSGGFTAPVDPNQVAGVVHGGEWVAPAWMVKRYSGIISALERLRQKGHKSGGYVVPGFGPKDESYILDTDTAGIMDKTLTLLINAIDTLTPVVETMSDGMLKVVATLKDLVSGNEQATSLLDVLETQLASSSEGLSGLVAALKDLKKQLQGGESAEPTTQPLPTAHATNSGSLTATMFSEGIGAAFPDMRTWWDKIRINLNLFATEIGNAYQDFKENKLSDAIKAAMDRLAGATDPIQKNLTTLGIVVGGVVGYLDKMLGLSQAFMDGFLKPLQPALKKIQRPMTVIGELLGEAIVPVLEMWVPIIDLIARGFIMLYNNVIVPFLRIITLGFIKLETMSLDEYEAKRTYEEENVTSKTYSAGVTGSVTNNITIEIDTYGLTDPEGIKKLWELLQGYAGDLELARG